jgi:hypothetical protein
MENALHEEIGDGDRTLAQDQAAQTILGAVRAIRAGRNLPQALEAHISDDPDTQLATNIAQQILSMAHEPAPELQEVDARAYPRHQQRFADKVAKQAEAAGLVHVADGEAHGLFEMLGQHVLMRFFADESGEIGVASFVLKPKWPGVVGFLFLLLTGKWRQHPMVECVSQFDDGTLLSTQYDSISAFEYGGTVRIERVPRGTPVQALLERHQQRVAAHKAAFPAAVAMVADDLAGMERRWIEGQRVKRAYRVSVGYATDAELQRLLGAQHARFGGKVREQLQALAADYE